MMEILLSVLLGILCGIFVGVLPGIGGASLMLITYPILIHINMIPLFLFYFALINSSQYYGSVSSIVFGVTGELSSIPAVQNGHPLFLQGKGNEALIYTSTGSFLASFIGITLFGIIAIVFSDYFIFMLKGKVIFTTLVVITVLLIISSKKIILSTVMGIIGYVVSQIGYNDLLFLRFLTFNISALDGGIPIYPLFCGIIIIPLLIEQQTKKIIHISTDKSAIKIIKRLKLLFDFTYVSSMVRGGFIGFFIGLVPGASYTISSSVAEQIEKLSHKKSLQKNEQLMRNLISAESANNCAAVSALIPMIVLAIPIIFSEAIFLGLVESKGFNTSVSLMYFDKYFWQILLSLLIINVINWAIAGLFYNVIVNIYNKLQKYIYIIVGTIVLGIMVYFGFVEYRLILSLIVCFFATILGVLIKHDQAKFVLIYVYFIATMLADEFYRLFLV